MSETQGSVAPPPPKEQPSSPLTPTPLGSDPAHPNGWVWVGGERPLSWTEKLTHHIDLDKIAPFTDKPSRTTSEPTSRFSPAEARETGEQVQNHFNSGPLDESLQAFALGKAPGTSEEGTAVNTLSSGFEEMDVRNPAHRRNLPGAEPVVNESPARSRAHYQEFLSGLAAQNVAQVDQAARNSPTEAMTLWRNFARDRRVFAEKAIDDSLQPGSTQRWPLLEQALLQDVEADISQEQAPMRDIASAEYSQDAAEAIAQHEWVRFTEGNMLFAERVVSDTRFPESVRISIAQALRTVRGEDLPQQQQLVVEAAPNIPRDMTPVEQANDFSRQMQRLFLPADSPTLRVELSRAKWRLFVTANRTVAEQAVMDPSLSPELRVALQESLRELPPREDIQQSTQSEAAEILPASDAESATISPDSTDQRDTQNQVSSVDQIDNLVPPPPVDDEEDEANPDKEKKTYAQLMQEARKAVGTIPREIQDEKFAEAMKKPDDADLYSQIFAQKLSSSSEKDLNNKKYLRKIAKESFAELKVLQTLREYNQQQAVIEIRDSLGEELDNMSEARAQELGEHFDRIFPDIRRLVKDNESKKKFLLMLLQLVGIWLLNEAVAPLRG